MPFYERGQVRIHYEEVGSGFPLLVIPGGGLNSTVAGLATGVARRRSGAPLCRSDGDRASRAQRAGEPLSVEGHSRQDSAGGASYPHLSPRPSTCCRSAIDGSRRPVAPDTAFPASGGLARWPTDLASGNDGNAASPAVRSGRR